MPAPVVRPNAAKWVRNATAAQQDYVAGVTNPTASWAANAAAAAPNYTTGVQAAITNNSFANGVKRAGDQAWSNGALGKGKDRYVPGVQAGQQAYEQGVAPYLQVIAATNLPARGPRGSQTNQTRSTILQQALFQKRLAMQKSGS